MAKRFTYHGETELTYRHYDDTDTAWVVVPLCKTHAESANASPYVAPPAARKKTSRF